MTASAKLKAKWAVGDLVQTKVGGPKMMVDSVDLPRVGGILTLDEFGDGEPTAEAKAQPTGIRYWCSWWTGGKLTKDRFPEETLTDWVEATK